MRPKTPLPWAELPCYFDNQCEAFEPKDADYIVHACNAYPRLIALLKIINTGDYPIACEIVALLKELEEL